MSGTGTSELILLFVIGLLVLGPERLPKVAREVGRWIGLARREAHRLRRQLETQTMLTELGRTGPDQLPRAGGSGSEHAPPAQAESMSQAGAEADAGEPLRPGASDDVDVARRKQS